MGLLRGGARCVLIVALSGTAVGCGHHPPGSSASPASASSASSISSTALAATPYPSDLAAAVRTRGFNLTPPTDSHPPVTVDAAIVASRDFRPPGRPVAVHLALVTTPGFTSLHFASPSPGKLFDAASAWLVVYHGQEAGQSGTWVVFVDATTGEAESMVGFGAHLQGGAPCPNNRCIFE